jgi:hypothetical protein
LHGAIYRAPLMAKLRRSGANVCVQESDSLTNELEQSRAELLQLAARVQRLIGKRGERDALLQRLRRTASMPGSVKISMPAYHLCSLCATSYAELAIHQVRGAAPGTKCDQCGEPALVWVQLKARDELAAHEVAH